MRSIHTTKTPLFSLVALAALLDAGCPGKLAVDVPTTLGAAKERAHGTDVVVNVVHVQKPRATKGAAEAKDTSSADAVSSPEADPCGKSPLCNITTPTLLKKVMFPDVYDDVAIVDHGTEVVRAAYDANGDLLQARTTKDGIVHDVRQLDLQMLGKKLVVEVASGKVGERTAPLPILPRHDVIADYKAAFAAQHPAWSSDGRNKGHLLLEALTWLDAEAMPFVTTELASAADDERATLLAGVCEAGGMPAGLHALLTAASTGVKSKTASVVVGQCLAPASGAFAASTADAPPFLTAFVDALCSGNTDISPADWTGVLARGSTDLQAAAKASVKQCADPGAHALVALSVGDDVDDAAATAALQTRFGRELVKLLDPQKHAPVLVAALADEKLTPGVIAGLKDKTNLPAALLPPIIDRFVHGTPGSFCSPFADRLTLGRALVKGMAADARPAVITALTAARTTAKDPGLVDAVLVGLGEQGDGPELKKVLATQEPRAVGAVCRDTDVAAFLLADAGCKLSDLDAPKVKCPSTDAPKGGPPSKDAPKEAPKAPAAPPKKP